MSNLSEKFTREDLRALNDKLNIATYQLNEITLKLHNLDESDIYKLLISFDGISRTAGMLNSILEQLLNEGHISTADPMSYIHAKSDLTFSFLDQLQKKHITL